MARSTWHPGPSRPARSTPPWKRPDPYYACDACNCELMTEQAECPECGSDEIVRI